MTDWQELEGLLSELAKSEKIRERPEVRNPKEALAKSAQKAGRAFSGSWLGYHARVYYEDLSVPEPGDHFTREWGLRFPFGRPRTCRWHEFTDDAIQEEIRRAAGDPDLQQAEHAAEEVARIFEKVKEEALAILRARKTFSEDQVVDQALVDIDAVDIKSAVDLIRYIQPKGTFSTHDHVAANQGIIVPPHIKIEAQLFELDAPFTACTQLSKALKPAMLHLKRVEKGPQSAMLGSSPVKNRVFIGHGRSKVWKDLKDFLQDRLHLSWDEFNREATAGKTTIQRLTEMLDSAGFAFLIMTAEDEQADGKMVARQNVIHEVGLFQGRLGFTKAIVLLEDGCEEFSNIEGLSQIRFPKGHVSASFEEIRKTLERENIIPSTTPTKKKIKVL